jgi:signal transduction histidine kinase
MDAKSSQVLVKEVVDNDELLKHKSYLEALDEAASILLYSISEINYKDYLRMLGPASGVDRIYIFLKRDCSENVVFDIEAQWNSDPKYDILDRNGHDYFVKNVWPNWQPILERGESISLPLSKSDPKDIGFWKKYNIKTLLALPIIIDGDLRGFMSFDNCMEERRWTKSETEFLHTTANNLAIAIKRLDIKNELKRAHAELEQRVEQRTAALQEANTRLLRTIEERDRIQNVLRETEKLAAAGKLAAQIAHEINNPLAGIKNSLLLIKEAVDKNHRYFEYVERVQKEIDRVSNIVRKMFDLYRPNVAVAKQFRLYNTIKDVTELLTAGGDQKNINIEINCDPASCITISEDLLRQIIYNLINNAIQAGGPNTKVNITAISENGFLKMSIADEGPGIDDKIKDKIFEPFFTTGMGGPQSGLGLGLAITKDIITAMRGTITFENLQPKGTRFILSIPLNNEPIQK